MSLSIQDYYFAILFDTLHNSPSVVENRMLRRHRAVHQITLSPKEVRDMLQKIEIFNFFAQARYNQLSLFYTERIGNEL